MAWDTPTYINGEPHSHSNKVGNWFDNPPIGGAPDPAAAPTGNITPRGSWSPSQDSGYTPPGVIEWPLGPGVWPPI